MTTIATGDGVVFHLFSGVLGGLLPVGPAAGPATLFLVGGSM